MSIGEQIKKLRIKKGCSQQDLANYLSVSRQTVSKWELDKSLPNLDYLLNLADFFEVSLDEMVGRKSKNLVQRLFNKNKKGGKIAMTNFELEKSRYYSSFENDLKSLLLQGKRVNSFIEIQGQEYPQGYIKTATGTPNCTLIIKDDGFDVIQLGTNQGLRMKKAKTILFRLAFSQVTNLQLSVKKIFDAMNGSCFLNIDLFTNGKELPLKFSINSLKPLILIWFAEDLAKIPKQVPEYLKPLLKQENLETIRTDVEKISAEIPFFYEK